MVKVHKQRRPRIPKFVQLYLLTFTKIYTIIIIENEKEVKTMTKAITFRDVMKKD